MSGAINRGCELTMITHATLNETQLSYTPQREHRKLELGTAQHLVIYCACVVYVWDYSKESFLKRISAIVY